MQSLPTILTRTQRERLYEHCEAAAKLFMELAEKCHKRGDHAGAEALRRGARGYERYWI